MKLALSIRAMAVYLRLQIFLIFALISPAAYSIDPQEIAHCVGRFCSVDSSSIALSQRLRPELTKEELFLGCSPGIPLRGRELPEGFVYADRHKKSMILPVVGDLERFIEPGDILIHGESEAALEKRRKLLAERGTLDLYSIANLNYVHTQLVYADREKKLRVLEAPQNVDPKTGINTTGPEETDRPFHILRLRKDIDPEKRAAAIEKINQFARFFGTGVVQRKGNEDIFWPIFSYNKNFEKLAVCDPAKRQLVLKAFAQFEAGEPDYYKPLIKVNEDGRDSAMLEFLCSGIPAAVYSLSDQAIPEMKTLPDVLNHLEELVKDGNGNVPAPISVLLEKYVDDHFKDSGRWPPDVGTKEERKAYEESKRTELPSSVKAYKKDLLLKLNGLMALKSPARGEAFRRTYDSVITPADYFWDIFSEKGSLTYAGTYVGKPCADRVQSRK